jgi:hypothetical protein
MIYTTTASEAQAVLLPSNDRMINAWLTGSAMEVSGRAYVKVLPDISLETQGNHEETVIIFCDSAEIWTGRLPYTSQKRYSLSQRVRSETSADF